MGVLVGLIVWSTVTWLNRLCKVDRGSMFCGMHGVFMLRVESPCVVDRGSWCRGMRRSGRGSLVGRGLVDRGSWVVVSWYAWP